jgi:hypothetical protein
MRETPPRLPFLLRDGASETSGSIDRTPFTVGRSPDRDLVLAHPYVSRRHAAIIDENGQYYVADEQSRHGRKVTRHALADHDEIHFGALDGPSLTVGARASTGSTTIHEILDQIPAINASVSGLEKLRWFFESARKLNTYGAVDQILAVLLETTIQLTNVERGYVFLSSATGEFDLALGRSSTGELLADDGSLSRSAIEKARRTVSEYIVTDTFSEEAIARSESIVAHNIRAVICIPLRNRRRTDELLGLLYLDSRLTVGSLTQIDSDLLRTIATEAAALIDNAQLAIAEENERRYREELNIAAQIQQGLMSVQIPHLAYAAIDARSVPCTQVGGDFYDVVVDRDSVSVVIADVSGKGISAAILASTLQGMIYAQLLSRQPLEQIAQVVNDYICVKNVGKYATLAMRPPAAARLLRQPVDRTQRIEPARRPDPQRDVCLREDDARARHARAAHHRRHHRSRKQRRRVLRRRPSPGCDSPVRQPRSDSPVYEGFLRRQPGERRLHHD